MLLLCLPPLTPPPVPGNNVTSGRPLAPSINPPPAAYLSFFPTAALYMVGALWVAFSLNVTSLISARVLVGLGVGISSYLTPIYIAEVVLLFSFLFFSCIHGRSNDKDKKWNKSPHMTISSSSYPLNRPICRSKLFLLWAGKMFLCPRHILLGSRRRGPCYNSDVKFHDGPK